MAKITVYAYRLFDEHSETWIRSRALATRRAIDAAGGLVVEGSEQEVDIEMVNADGIVVRWPQDAPTKP